MSSKVQGLVLTKSQAACLIAVRHGKDSKTKIAVDAKLDLRNAATALRVLTRLGLAQQGRTERWHTTGRGQTCRFKTVPDRARRNSDLPGPGVRRLLKLLDRPMRGMRSRNNWASADKGFTSSWSSCMHKVTSPSATRTSLFGW